MILMCVLIIFFFPFCNLVFSFCNLLPPSFPSGIQLFAPQTLRSKRSRVNTQLRFGIKNLNIHFVFVNLVEIFADFKCVFFFTARFGLGRKCVKTRRFTRGSCFAARFLSIGTFVEFIAVLGGRGFGSETILVAPHFRALSPPQGCFLDAANKAQN